jgi:Ca2+-binding RTX toxin-like protein
VARDSDFAYLAEKILLTRWEDELIETWLFHLDCKVSTHPPQSLGRSIQVLGFLVSALCSNAVNNKNFQCISALYPEIKIHWQWSKKHLLISQPNMAPIFGTAIADSLVGEQGRDLLFGYQGDDTLAAYGGNDTLYGGAGNDRLDAYLGNNLLFGGKGNDELVADAGNDTLFGGQGNDLLSGYEGNDFLSGDSGNDTLLGIFVASLAPGGGEIDTLVGGAGNDYFELAYGNFEFRDSTSIFLYPDRKRRLCFNSRL